MSSPRSLAVRAAATCAVAVAALPVVAGAAVGQAPEWPMVQGGVEHAGTADGPEPPLQVAWRRPLGASGDRGAGGPILVGGLLVAVGREEVTAVEPETGRVRWSVARLPGPPVTPAASADGGTLVFPEGASREQAAVVGLDLATRSVRWRYRAEGVARTAPAVHGELAFVGTETGEVVALDLSDGTARWRYEAGGRVRAAPAVAGDLVYAVSEDVSATDVAVHAVRVSNGEMAWRFGPGRPAASGSAVTVAGERVYVGLGDGDVRALDASSGDELWSKRGRAGFSAFTLPAAAGEDALIGDGTGNLYRVDGRNGNERWRFQFPAPFVEGAPLVVGGFAVVGRLAGTGEDGIVSALDLDDGRLVWETVVDEGSVTPLASDGERLYAGVIGPDGGLVALEPDPGGDLVSIESPSALHLDRALLNFAVAFAVLVALALLWFRLLVPRRIEPKSAGGYR